MYKMSEKGKVSHSTFPVYSESPNMMPDSAHSHDEFIVGFGAAFINITVTFPMNKLMFRQQLHGISVVQAVAQLKHEGLSHIYRGLLPPLLQKTTSLAIMFGMYDKFHTHLHRHFSQSSSLLIQASAGMMAGCVEALLAPFERIQTLLQDRARNNTFVNTKDAARSLLRYGLPEYYRGLSAVLLRNGPSNAMFFIGRTKMKQLFPETESNVVDFLQNFTSGAILGAVTSTIFFPVNVVKTRMQCKLGGEFLGIYYTYKVLVAERGKVRMLFRGVHVNFTRSLVSWGIINASYEILKDALTMD